MCLVNVVWFPSRGIYIIFTFICLCVSQGADELVFRLVCKPMDTEQRIVNVKIGIKKGPRGCKSQIRVKRVNRQMIDDRLREQRVINDVIRVEEETEEEKKTRESKRKEQKERAVLITVSGGAEQRDGEREEKGRKNEDGRGNSEERANSKERAPLLEPLLIKQRERGQ